MCYNARNQTYEKARAIMARYFTVAEANALLPALRPRVARLVAAWQRLSAVQEQAVAILERKPRADLGGAPLTQAAADIVSAQNAMVAIQALGVEALELAGGQTAGAAA